MNEINLFESAPVPKAVSTELTFSDRLGGWKVRWNFGRNNYRVEPGLYSIGNPDDNSAVLVTANYKLTFDHLRSKLNGLDLWIMVLDTKGINVWCAAGKGTFGTDELVLRIGSVRLKKYVSHRKLIVPQLGAVGVAAHEVLVKSGFKVVFGPIRAVDIKEYLSNKMKVTERMRRVQFSFWDRMVLAPVEIMGTVKYMLPLLLALIVIGGFGENIFSFDRMFSNIPITLILFLCGWLGGTLLTPILLPWLPGRPFALKGVFAGLLLSAVTIITIPLLSISSIGYILGLSWLLIILSISSFHGMNFTGSSTYTSLSGVKKEMKYAVPLQAAAVVIGIGLLMTNKFI